jgi:hypothetical protein
MLSQNFSFEEPFFDEEEQKEVIIPISVSCYIAKMDKSEDDESIFEKVFCLQSLGKYREAKEC